MFEEALKYMKKVSEETCVVVMLKAATNVEDTPSSHFHSNIGIGRPLDIQLISSVSYVLNTPGAIGDSMNLPTSIVVGAKHVSFQFSIGL